LAHSLGKGEVDSSILSGSTRKNSVAEMLYLAGRGHDLPFLKSDFRWILRNMRRRDASIWFMIAAAVFAALAVLALLLVYGPA
jgi:hypothetical protein